MHRYEAQRQTAAMVTCHDDRKGKEGVDAGQIARQWPIPPAGYGGGYGAFGASEMD